MLTLACHSVTLHWVNFHSVCAGLPLWNSVRGRTFPLGVYSLVAEKLLSACLDSKESHGGGSSLILHYPDRAFWFHSRHCGHLINTSCKWGITTLAVLSQGWAGVQLESMAFKVVLKKSITPQIQVPATWKTCICVGIAKCTWQHWEGHLRGKAMPEGTCWPSVTLNCLTDTSVCHLEEILFYAI